MVVPVPLFITIHLLVSGAAAALFAWRFGHVAHAAIAHVLLLAAWDLTLAAAVAAVRPFTSRGARAASWIGMIATGTLQVYLYALNAVSNFSWGRNITGLLVVEFAPTVWSEKEPFPVGRIGISAFACATIVAIAALLAWFGPALDRARPRRGRLRLVGAATVMALLFGATLSHAIEARDSLLWKEEMVASFFRPVGFAFEPTARREAVADRDARIETTYPRHVASASRKNVVLVIVDSLRADRMQVYGYDRPTTPFLSELVGSGRMKKVDAAFSTCSESFCGITSTLSSREFRDISARTFQLQDALRDEGYPTWFILSGNHSAWNGLPQFYHAGEGMLFDGSYTRRYTMDDDRLVLEGLEHVPPARPGQPAFFYLHLMSTHYLGVQFPESHVFTRPDDDVSPGLEPYKILDKLEKPDRYDDKVRQADGVIRQIFSALAAKHYLDDAVVVVTGDHGEGLGERHWAHGWHLYNEDIRIPLLLYDAPAAAYPDLSFAAQVDIAPTILDRLGLPIPSSWEGQSLLAPTRERFTYHQTYFVPNRFAVIYRDDRALYKFIATPQYGKEELYDLSHDPGEARDLTADRPALAAVLRDKVRAYRGR